MIGIIENTFDLNAFRRAALREYENKLINQCHSYMILFFVCKRSYCKQLALWWKKFKKTQRYPENIWTITFKKYRIMFYSFVYVKLSINKRISFPTCNWRGPPIGFHGIRDKAFLSHGIQDLLKKSHWIRDWESLQDAG